MGEGEARYYKDAETGEIIRIPVGRIRINESGSSRESTFRDDGVVTLLPVSFLSILCPSRRDTVVATVEMAVSAFMVHMLDGEILTSVHTLDTTWSQRPFIRGWGCFWVRLRCPPSSI